MLVLKPAAERIVMMVREVGESNYHFQNAYLIVVSMELMRAAEQFMFQKQKKRSSLLRLHESFGERLQGS